jgi:hypothetical protein
VIMRFENQRGRYMMQCHNLVHEDHDMMVQFEVGTGGPDPITADPATDQSQMGDVVSSATIGAGATTAAGRG